MKTSAQLLSMVSRWPWQKRAQGGERPSIDIERASVRIESYVYGNVLVLAALASVSLADVGSGRAALLVAGTVVSTFIAHLLAMTVGHRVRAHGSGANGSGANGSGAKGAAAGGDAVAGVAAPDASRHTLLDEVRDSVPIATSGLIPVIVLALGWAGWPPEQWAFGVAIAAVVLRFVTLGSVISYLSGDRNSWRNALIGVGLAVVAIVVAGIKFLITH